MAVSSKRKADVDTQPKPRFQGRFAVFDVEGGGIHIAWKPDEADDADTQHIELPGPIIAIIKQVSSGEIKNPMDIMKAVMLAGGDSG